MKEDIIHPSKITMLEILEQSVQMSENVRRLIDFNDLLGLSGWTQNFLLGGGANPQGGAYTIF